MTETIDRRSWRIAIRQADMIIRRRRERIEAAGSRHGRLRKREAEVAQILRELANEIWDELGMPPSTVRQAYDWDDKINAAWLEEPTRAAQD